MKFKEELNLLIKSKYSFIWIETNDEDYITSNIIEALYSDYKIYRWSLTRGLSVYGSNDSFYDSNEPVKALKLVDDIIASSQDSKSVFILYDIDKYFDKPVVVRYIKDILSKIKTNSITLIGVSPNPLNIKDFDNYVYRITGAFPDEDEIINIVNSEIANFSKTSKLNIAIEKKDVKRFVRALRGLTEKQIRNLVLRAIVEDSTLDLNDITKIELAKKEIFDKYGFLEYYEGEFEDRIGGFDNLKKWVLDRKRVMESNSLSVSAPRGILLTGIPGCGKSLSARIVGKMLDYPVYRFDPSMLYSKYIGESEENVRKVFDIVDMLSPVCLWIDEIEKIFSFESSDADGGVSRRIFSLFLIWFSERKNSTFVVATSNDITKLPPEFIRKGRFDEIFFVDLPNIEERKKIFKIHLGKRNINADNFNLDELSKLTEDFSGSEIEQSVISSIYSSSGNPQMNDLVNEIKKTTPLSKIKKDEFLSIRKWAIERKIPAV
jgi:SpoVK/Ycf46/Vps4 family AAA+-type ATPase